MTKGLQRSLNRAPIAEPTRAVNQLDIPLNSLPITINGATGIGFGSVVLADLPEGNIQIVGAVINVSFLEADAGIVDTFSGDFGVGTTPASDGTITGGDVDIIASTAIGPASGGAISAVRVANNTATIFDNTDGSLEINFNMLIDDANISADGTIVSLTGQLVLSFSVLGDD